MIQSFDDRAKTVELSSSVSEMISVQEIMDIVEKALHLSNVTEVVRKMSGSSSVLQYNFFPFMSSVSSLYFSNLTADTFTLTKLDDLIHSWKMKRYPVSKDGNCCFVSVANGIAIFECRRDSIELSSPRI